jgi:hypothetical protein
MEDRQMALQLWQANLEESNPEGIDDCWGIQWAKSQAVSKVTRVLMVTIRSESSREEQSLAMIQLIDKLVEVSTANGDDFMFNERVTGVARLLLTLGDEDRARNMVRQKLLDGFRNTEDNPTTFKYAFWLREVAGVLQAFDDEINAIAAWSLAVPDMDDAKEENPDDQSTTEADHDGTGSQDEQQVHGGAEPDVEDKEASSGHKEMSPDPKESLLRGPLGNTCDGRCGTLWTYADNMWVCKDCADVQFDPVCYDKLKNRTLERRVCSPLHHHFYIRPFQKERWLATPEDQMWVDGSLMSKKDWVEKIKVEWKIDEKTLLAVKAIESSKVAGDLLKRRQTVVLI